MSHWQRLRMVDRNAKALLIQSKNKPNTMKQYLPYLFSALLLFIAACAGGSDTQQQTDAEVTEQTDDIRTIEVIGTDRMRFVVEEEQEGITTGEKAGEYLLLESISAEPGEEIRIRLTTESDLPASAMAHNFVLLTLSADAMAFANAASKAKDNDYIPANMQDEILAQTGLAAGGETVEVTFTAPEEAGEYEYVCTFPGHFAGGMKGILRVE